MSAPSSYAIIQTVNPAVSTGTITATLAGTAVGNLILVFVGMSALTESVSTVTDNAGNTYTKAYSQNGGSGGDTELWYSRNSQPTTSVVVAFSGAVSTKSVFVREYGGMSPASTVLDRTISTSGSGTSVSTGASSTIQDSSELVVCNCVLGATTPTLTVGAGFGNFASQAIIGGLTMHAIEDLTASSLVAQTGLMTAGGTAPVWDVGLATFVIAGIKPVQSRLRPAPFKPGLAR